MRCLYRLTVVGILVLLPVCAASIYLYWLKRSADNVVRVSYELAQQQQPPTLDEIRQRFGPKLKQPDPCTPFGCGYEVMLSNRVVAELHLAPYTALRSLFWVKDGVVESNSIVFWTAGGQGRVVNVLTKYCDQCDSFVVNPCEDLIESVASGYVEIGYRSAAENKRTALTLGTACLATLRGCGAIPELLPTVWQRMPDGTIQCHIPNK